MQLLDFQGDNSRISVPSVSTDRLTRLQKAQDATFKAMLECLNTFGICNVVRPTGFGKTKMFMDYICMFPSQQFLYIYDVQSVVSDIQAKYAPKNVAFLSYAMLSSKVSWQTTRQWIYQRNWHTIIFDESHLMGGENISIFVRSLIADAMKVGIKILGGTATQVRTDTMNVTDEFFGGHTVYEYTLKDAIRDKIMLEPFWVITVHMDQLLTQLRRHVRGNSYQMERIAQLDRAYANKLNVDKVYRESVLKCFGYIPTQMQFIAFYPTIDSMNYDESQLRHDFSLAFPKHEVLIAKMSSDPDHYSRIIDLQQEVIATKPNSILLILSVNMLNQAYHSEKLTGIIMNRATSSNIIFTQQVGRALSAMAPTRSLIFDNVGNARISPDAFLMDMSGILALSRGKYRRAGGYREHNDITVEASMDVLTFLDWYARLCATCELTREQLDMARRNWERHRDEMSVEEFSKLSRIPSWYVQQEVARDGT